MNILHEAKNVKENIAFLPGTLNSELTIPALLQPPENYGSLLPNQKSIGKSMKDNTLRFLRLILYLTAGAMGVFLIQTLAEVLLTQLSLPRLSSLTPAEARSLVNLLNGKLNQAMSILFIVTGMAVPLTANLYSLKFLDLFDIVHHSHLGL